MDYSFAVDVTCRIPNRMSDHLASPFTKGFLKKSELLTCTFRRGSSPLRCIHLPDIHHSVAFDQTLPVSEACPCCKHASNFCEPLFKACVSMVNFYLHKCFDPGDIDRGEMESKAFVKSTVAVHILILHSWHFCSINLHVARVCCLVGFSDASLIFCLFLVKHWV